MSDIDSANPKFRKWLAAQSEAIRQDVTAKLAEIATHDDIAQNHRTGVHARLFRLLTHCKDAHGYDFS